MAVAGSANTINVGDRLKLDVYALAYGGEGIAKYQGIVVFVPEALPGDCVEVNVLQVKKRFARAEIINVVTPSEKRVQPFCNKADECGGCSWQNLLYSEQLKTKQTFVENAIQHIGQLKAIHISPTIKAVPNQGYRHKIQIPFQNINGELIGGFYTKHTHQVVPIEECPVQPGVGNKIYKTFLELARQYQYKGYDEATHEGGLRHLVIRIGKQTKEALVIIVTKQARLPKFEEFVKTLHHQLPDLVGIVHNINKEKTNVILGKESRTLFGRGFLYEEIRGVKYRISAESFFQVNPYQMDHLAQTAVSYAGLTGKEKVVDLYCGVGFFSFEAAKQARMVVGIESVSSAIDDALANKHLNNFSNIEFECNDATRGVNQLIKKGFMPDVLLVDPPRKGCDDHLIKKMMSWKTKRIIYVSCNPVTLARDLAKLSRVGYRVVQIQPIDLFPHTYHVESVASLVRRK